MEVDAIQPTDSRLRKKAEEEEEEVERKRQGGGIRFMEPGKKSKGAADEDEDDWD